MNEEFTEDVVEFVNKFCVKVDFVISAECIDEAETIVKELIEEGILHSQDKSVEKSDLNCEFDIVDSEPAELF